MLFFNFVILMSINLKNCFFFQILKLVGILLATDIKTQNIFLILSDTGSQNEQYYCGTPIKIVVVCFFYGNPITVSQITIVMFIT